MQGIGQIYTEEQWGRGGGGHGVMRKDECNLLVLGGNRLEFSKPTKRCVTERPLALAATACPWRVCVASIQTHSSVISEECLEYRF